MAFMRRFGICCLMLLLFISVGCSDPEKQKQAHYTKAMEYIEQSDTNSAVIELRNAIKIDPKFADARYQLALIHLEKGEMRDAFGQLKRTADLDPANIDAGVKVAEFLLLAKNIVESRKYTNQVLDKEPANPDALALLANIELIEGNHDAALAAIDRVPPDKVSTDRFYNIKGRIYTAKKDFTTGESMFQKALEIAPDNIVNYRTLLTFYQQQKKIDKAKKILTQLVARFPDNVQSYLLQANFYHAIGESEQAEKAALKALELEPKAEALHLMLAEFYKKEGDFTKAAEFLEKSKKTLPDSPEIKATLADCYFELRRFADAKSLVDNVLSSNPDHGRANFVNAKLLLQDNKIKEAIDLLSSITSNYPKWSDPFYFLALSHLRLGEVELASKANSEALTLAPAVSRIHTLQAQIFLIQGEAEEAGKEATIALRLNSHNLAAAKIMAKSLLQQKRFDEAINLTSQMLEQIPTDTEILGTLGLAYLGDHNPDKARQAFTSLLELNPSDSRALSLLANLAAKHDIPSAIALVNHYIELAPDASGHYMFLGNLQILNKQPKAALSSFKKAQELAPQNPQPYISRARIMHALGKTDQALAEFEDLLAKKPDSVPGNMGKATILEIQKKFPEAKNTYRRVLQLQPDQAVAANNLAYLIAQEEDSDLGEALRLAMLAKQAYPDQANIADTLGMVHFKRKAYGLAISQYQQALLNQPNDPVILYHLAQAQLSNNEIDKARESLKKSLASENGFAERTEAENLLKTIDAQ